MAGTGGILVAVKGERGGGDGSSLLTSPQLLETSRVVNHPSLQSSSYLKWKKRKRPRKRRRRVARSRSPACGNQPRDAPLLTRAAFLIEGANCRLTQLPGKALGDKNCQVLHQQPNTSMRTAILRLRTCEAIATSAPPSNRQFSVLGLKGPVPPLGSWG